MINYSQLNNISAQMIATSTEMQESTSLKELKNALDSVTIIIEMPEDKWIKHPQTLIPNDFNIKLNHHQNTSKNIMDSWVAI